MNPNYIFLFLAILSSFRYYFILSINIRYQSDRRNLKKSNEIIPISEEHYQSCLKSSKQELAEFLKWDCYILSFALLFVGFGGLGLVESLAVSLASPLSSSSLMEGVVFFFIIIYFLLLADIIQKYYMNFVKIKDISDLEDTDARDKTTFFKDYLIYTAISMAGTSLFLCCFYALIHFFPSSWLWVIFLSIILLIVGVNTLLPIVKLLHLKRVPLQEGELRQLLEKACEKADFSFEDISVVNKSLKSSRGNAYALGFLKKRVILHDTLIEALTPQEVVAVFLHEIGHHKLKHVWFQLAVALCIMLGFVVILSQYVVHPEVPTSFGLSPSKEYVTLLMYLLFFCVISPFSNVILMTLKRRQEFKADEYSYQLQPGNYLADALIKIGVILQKGLPFHHPLSSFLRRSHPTIIERVRALKKFGTS